MATLREIRPLPAGIDTPERVESFLTQLAARLAPGIEGSVGSIAWTIDGQTGVDWTAEGFLSDGTLVVVRVAPASNEIHLYLDGAPILKPPTEPSRWVNIGLLGTVLLGMAVGLVSGGILWGVGVTLATVATWVGVDVALMTRAQRRAASRPIDAESWRARLDQAIEEAIATM